MLREQKPRPSAVRVVDRDTGKPILLAFDQETLRRVLVEAMARVRGPRPRLATSGA
jgi:hypothetical protein